MAKRRKVIRAGRLVYAAVYSTVHPSDSPEARAAKTKCSSAARQRMNMKYAWQKLELLLVGQSEILCKLYLNHKWSLHRILD